MLNNISTNDPLKQSLKEFIELLNENTAEAYQRDISDYLNNVQQPDFSNSIAYFQSLAEQGYSKSTIGRKKAAISSFVDFLKDQRQVGTNPFTSKTFKMAIKKIYREADGNHKSNKPPRRPSRLG